MVKLCGEHVSVILFKANWCGYCKKFEPIYDKVAAWLNDNKIAHVFKFEHQNPKHEKVINSFNVKGFPLIVIHKGLVDEPNSYIQYMGERTLESFQKFVTLHCENPTSISVKGFVTKIYTI